MIVGLTDTTVSHFIKSEPYRHYHYGEWLVDTIMMSTMTDPKTNEQITSHTDTTFPLPALARFKKAELVTDENGTKHIKVRKYRNFKLVRMPRENQQLEKKEEAQ